MEEWQAMQALADDRSIVIIEADKGLIVVVCDCNDYILEAEKQLSDANVYRNLWEQVISFFKTSDLEKNLVINSLNILRISIKKFLT